MYYDRFCTYSCDAECVNCGDCNPQEVFTCFACGEEVECEDELSHDFCKDCRMVVKQRLADYLSKEFFDEEIELIDEALEGNWLTDFIAEYRSAKGTPT